MAQVPMPKSAMSHRRSHPMSDRQKVVIAADVVLHEKRKSCASAIPPDQVTVPPPSMPTIKDEVEMLRSGFKDKHGNAVKTQAAQIVQIEMN